MISAAPVIRRAVVPTPWLTASSLSPVTTNVRGTQASTVATCLKPSSSWHECDQDVAAEIADDQHRAPANAVDDDASDEDDSDEGRKAGGVQQTQFARCRVARQ